LVLQASLRKKELDEAVAAVGEQLKGDKNKNRDRQELQAAE